MNRYAMILLFFFFVCSHAAAVQSLMEIRSEGSLNFRLNGQLYTAASAHARGYAVKQTMVGYINGANSEDMVIGIEVKDVKGKGVYNIDNSNGKVDFTIQHKTYTIVKPGDYLKLTINSVKEQGAFLLLGGFFEGQLQDKAGNKVVISEGKFETVRL